MSDLTKVKIGDVCTVTKGVTGIQKAIAGKYPMVTLAEDRRTHNEFQFDCKAVIVPLVSSTGHGHASMNRVHYQEGKFALGSILCAVVPNDSNFLNPKYLHIYLSYLKDKLLVPLMRGAANVSLSISNIKTVEVVVPPIKRQLEIIELEKMLCSQNKKLKEQHILQKSYLTLLRQQILQGKSVGTVKLKSHVTNSIKRVKESNPSLHMIGVSNSDGITNLVTNKKDGFEKYKLVDKHSFIYNPMRINVGSIALYEDNETCITSPDYVVFKVSNKYPINVLIFFLKSKQGLQEIAENVQGSVRQRLYFENLCNINIPEFTSEDYKAIEGLFYKLDKLEDRINQNKKNADMLMQAFLADEFSS